MSTELEMKVWEAISKIPRGHVRTYSQLAFDIGKPKAVRAVASACGRNKKLVTIPCHRVVRKDGSLGGYSGPGGLDAKKKLLIQEGVDPDNTLKFTY
jgi:methylated-DNA-[protein]-cysteine S-methyltransferase